MNSLFRKRRDGGFSLPELLVAMAVFSILLSAIAGLFYASLRSTRSGYLAAEANEEARVLMGVIERDLASAFTAREYGDYYQFYGTPLGMAFVGLARSYDATVDAGPNLSRVTYVLHSPPYNPNNPNTPIPGYGRSHFVTTPHDAIDPDAQDVRQNTYALVRYVERGVNDLDNFPVDCAMLRGLVAPETDPEIPDYREVYPQFAPEEINRQFTMLEELADPTVMGGDVWPDHVVENLLQAKKRQLWIRLLAETNWWDMPPLELDAFPQDYILGQHIRGGVDARLAVPQNGIEFTGPDEPRLASNDMAHKDHFMMFQYGLVGRPDITWRPFWNAQYNLSEPQILQDNYVVVDGQYITAFTPELYGRVPYSEVFDFRVLREMLVPPGQLDPAVREMPELIGSPVNPRLPEVVRLRMELIYENPALGAPNFRRPIDRIIKVPSGYMRTKPW